MLLALAFVLVAAAAFSVGMLAGASTFDYEAVMSPNGLLGCPFCALPPGHGLFGQNYFIVCQGCEGCFVIQPTKERAFAVWNTRASLSVVSQPRGPISPRNQRKKEIAT